MTKTCTVRQHVRRIPDNRSAVERQMRLHAELRVDLAMREACQEIMSSFPPKQLDATEAGVNIQADPPASASYSMESV